MTNHSRMLTHIALWLYQYSYLGVIDHRIYYQFVSMALEATHELHDSKLPEFWLSHSSAFTRKQIAIYKQVISLTQSLKGELLSLGLKTQYLNPNKNFSSLITEIKQEYLQPLETILEAFDERDTISMFVHYLYDTLPFTLPSEGDGMKPVIRLLINGEDAEAICEVIDIVKNR